MKNRPFTARFQQPFAFIFILGLLSVMLAGCQLNASRVAKKYQNGIPRDSHLAIMPFVSHSPIPDEETVTLNRILLVQLAAVGIASTTSYERPEASYPVPGYLADTYKLEQFQIWARVRSIDLSISGEILKWQYDEQNRFSTAIQLKITDIASGEEIWRTNGKKEGLPGEDAYDVNRKLIANLVATMPIQ